MTTRLYYDHVLVRPKDSAQATEHIVMPSGLTDQHHGDNLELIRKDNTMCLGQVVAVSLAMPKIVKKRVATETWDYVRVAGVVRPDVEPGDQIVYQRAGGALITWDPALDLPPRSLDIEAGEELVVVREGHIFFAIAGAVVQERGGLRSVTRS